MKSYISIVFTALLLLSGCATDTAEPETPEIPSDEPQVPEEPTVPEESIDVEIDEEASEQESNTEEEARQIVVEGGNYFFEPENIDVEQGETIEFVFENTGGTHDFVIPELGIGTEVIAGGESESFTHTFEETGEFEFECSVGNHAEQGMVGTITVE